ncbi:MAG: alpha-amylase/4-alpha-glucanotransferase domain-containing protein, partial [Deltaproteobacteria bacterium]
SYGPFLKALSKHPSMKLTLHTSGFLLDWLMDNRPEYIELLKSMVARGQAEIMGGGYYEPILQVISPDDRLNQITMMSDKIEEVFGSRPRGIWLAERVWEPDLPTTLKKAGMEYILVDDYHFIKSGLGAEDLGGYYITEDQGNIIKVLPGSEALRYLIPFKPIDALEAHLSGLNGFFKRGNAAIYGDDGEKFGVWPGTAKWVFDEGWLEAFLDWMESNLHWLKPVKIGEYMDGTEPVGRVYLPATSYMEMGEWSLPATASREYGELIEEAGTRENGDKARRFFQGGTWRNFFSKYPEANWMHKRMLLASRGLRERAEGRQWDDDLAEAERLLFKSQCNDAYWHGVFGGLYLPHLRTEVYRNLIEAENLTTIEHAFASAPSITVADMDADGFDEVIIRNRDLNLFVSPRNGGSLVELDYKPRAVNFSNTLSRWFEGYHHKLEKKKGKTEGDEGAEGTRSIHDVVLVKEDGLERYLKYDNARRASFVDRFLADDVTLESVYDNKYEDLGDFSNNGYKADIRGASLVLSREGEVGGGRVL